MFRIILVLVFCVEDNNGTMEENVKLKNDGDDGEEKPLPPRAASMNQLNQLEQIVVESKVIGAIVYLRLAQNSF